MALNFSFVYQHKELIISEVVCVYCFHEAYYHGLRGNKSIYMYIYIYIYIKAEAFTINSALLLRCHVRSTPFFFLFSFFSLPFAINVLLFFQLPISYHLPLTKKFLIHFKLFQFNLLNDWLHTNLLSYSNVAYLRRKQLSGRLFVRK